MIWSDGAALSLRTDCYIPLMPDFPADDFLISLRSWMNEDTNQDRNTNRAMNERRVSLERAFHDGDPES